MSKEFWVLKRVEMTCIAYVLKNTLLNAQNIAWSISLEAIASKLKKENNDSDVCIIVRTLDTKSFSLSHPFEFNSYKGLSKREMRRLRKLALV